VIGWENGISCTGTARFISNKMGMHVTDLSSTATETMGFVLWDNEIQSNILLGNGKRIPLQDPLYSHRSST
jgi:hypothetical protein